VNNFSKNLKKLKQASSIYFNEILYGELKKGKDIISLSLGEAFFDLDYLYKSKFDHITGSHYSSSRGQPELLKKISQYYLRYYKSNVDYKNEILISAGSKALIYFSMLAFINKNDEILINEPGWVSYAEQAKLVGAKVNFFKVDKNFSDVKISKKTKMIIINNPNNPSGYIFPQKKLEQIYNECLKRKIILLVDEAYSDFLESKFFYSLARKKNKKYLLIINSLSKNFGLSGWRIGYMISEKNNINQIEKINQHIITCAPTVLQNFLSNNFQNMLNTTLPQIKNIIVKRKKILNFLKKINLKFHKGNSTFYIFLDLSNYSGNINNLALYLLLEKKISVVPGFAYGKNFKKFIRISIGTETEDRIFLGLATIKNLLKSKFTNLHIQKLLKKNGYEKFN
tara:strand:+ start:2449 stop:3639 length:1191 start_codon:yes stop_codon:yes gene_type:complete